MRDVQTTHDSTLRDQRGVALVTVLLLALALSAIVAASVRISGNNDLINRYHDRHAELSSLADGALEEARARINSGDISLPGPDQSYVTVEEDAPVTDASGEVIPNVRRSLWAGRTGDTTGQFGTFAAVVAELEDDFGNRVVRKLRLEQESFAKFAYYTDIEPSNIRFGSGDEILGPLHTNSDVRMWECDNGNPCVTFHGEVTTAGDVQTPQRGDFRKGFSENVAEIPMPETEELTALESRADAGDTKFEGMTTSDLGEATTRIEFVTLDVDGNGEIEKDEGFIRVYQVDDASEGAYVTASYDYGDDLDSEWAEHVCGDLHDEDGDGDVDEFVTVAEHSGGDWADHEEDSDARCYLGGDPALNDGVFNATQGPDGGRWLQWPGSVDPDVASAAPAHIDAGYLFPISHARNPSFKGVIYVDGDVALDGVLRGRVTVAATGEIVLADDLTYATPPGAEDRACDEDDLLGLFAGENVVIADNAINTPVEIEGGGGGGGGGGGSPGPPGPPGPPGGGGGGSADFHIYDGSDDPYRGNEYFHGVALALEEFTVENYDIDDFDNSAGPGDGDGPVSATECEGQMWGRGCIFLTGGVIQETRGPVGLSSGSGYLKRYDYDQCAAEMPPPFFPTTGRFQRDMYFQINPRTFELEQEFDQGS